MLTCDPRRVLTRLLRQCLRAGSDGRQARPGLSLPPLPAHPPHGPRPSSLPHVPRRFPSPSPHLTSPTHYFSIAFTFTLPLAYMIVCTLFTCFSLILTSQTAEIRPTQPVCCGRPSQMLTPARGTGLAHAAHISIRCSAGSSESFEPQLHHQAALWSDRAS